MKKKLFYILIAFSLFLILAIPAYNINSKNPESMRFIKNLMPNEFKDFLKKTVFYIPESIRKNKELKKRYDEKIETNKLLNEKLIDLMQTKNLVNEEVFPQTQFLKLNFYEQTLSKLNAIQNRFIDKKRDGKKISPFFIEALEEKTLLIAVNGTTLLLNTEKIITKQNSDELKIKNNLPKDITVTDSIIHKDQIFISFVKKNKTCESIEIYNAKINFDSLNFKEFYSQGVEGSCDQNPLGGRMAVYNYMGNPSLLISVKDPNKKNHFLLDQYNENLEYKFSVILRIDMNKKDVQTFSSGHRNPQGLLVNENNIIISTEHGPRGGDEINKIEEGKNYGWPKASYGENYNENYNEMDKYKYEKNHSSFGFKEPIYSFTPSIAISQIIKVPEEFSSRWKNNYLVTTLRSLSLFRVIFDDKFSRIINMEKITVGKRIRDIAYNKKYNSFLLALEDETGGIAAISAQK